MLSRLDDDPAVTNAAEWNARRAPLLRAAFQNRIYGWLPADDGARVTTRRQIATGAYPDARSIEEVTVRLDGAGAPVLFRAVIFLPQSNTATNAPVIIAPNFCGNEAALGFSDSALDHGAWLPSRCRTLANRTITRFIHGQNIIRPPFERLLRAGYAVVTFYPGEIVPDEPMLAAEAIARLPGQDRGPTMGAVGAWAWSISRAVDIVAADARFDHSHVAVFGHSRFGKAALLAAALDERITAVIANQSGRLGAAPSARNVGESLNELSRRFPHWFPIVAQSARENAPNLDQEALLALIAPRAILLGGASLDRWSDPVGSYEGAAATNDVYRLFGGHGLTQSSIETPDYSADIAFFMRPGRHGIRDLDWTAAIAFLDAHRNGTRYAQARP
ncbi:MAG: hypothetical protein K2P70_01700 [Hyphomonadaceae bacterium]|nr:hypothetical protein [Hyphomonadaceae bacterium]